MTDLSHDPSRRHSLSLLCAAALPVCGVLVTLTVLFLVSLTRPERLLPHEHTARAAALAEARRLDRLEQRFGQEVSTLDPYLLARGAALFAQSCAACHGADGEGVAVLGGKNLIESDFVAGLDDAGLAAFLAHGRAVDDPANTTGMVMPAKGGNPDLDADDLQAIVAHLRGVQDPRRVPKGRLPMVVLETEPEETPQAPLEQAVAVAEAQAPETAAVALVATEAEQQPLDPEAVKRGKRVYMSCIACHGRNGTGVKGVGKDLVASAFVLGSSDDELLAFIKQGRGPSDPANTTGLAMPPKGGNPSLKDEQIRDVIAYIRSLSRRAASGQAQGATR